MMASPTESEIRTSPDTIPRTKAGSIRKLRIPKACYPCYKRKVKCDKNLPCSLCVKRGYAHLCTFTHPPTTVKTRPSSQPVSRREESWHSAEKGGNFSSCEGVISEMAGATRMNYQQQQHNIEPTSNRTIVAESGNVLIDTREWRQIQDRLAALSQTIHSLRSQMDITEGPSSSTEVSPQTPPSSSSDNNTTLSSPTSLRNDEKAEGVRTRNALGGSPVHCGSDSVMAFLLGKEKSSQRSASASVFREDSVLSQLALDNQSATYPFLDLWSANITSYSNGSVCAALPEDRICRRLLRSYHDVRLTLYPAIPDFEQFQRDVYTLLETGALTGLCASDAPFGFSITFVGMLFAVLASGCQVSDFTKSERTSMCQLYISCAYQCLRNGNFLSRPNMEAIQTLLIIGDVLSYNMNPGIAYVTFGVAQRMAMTIGLHAESSVFKDPGANRRQELWWTMAWQDSHFGLSYDRPIETLSSSPQIPRAADSKPGMRGYFETMCSVISLILQLLREETLAGYHVNDKTIPAYKTELDKILADAAPHLRSEDYCFTLKNHVERLTLKLRSSYLVSEICRRSLKPTPSAAAASTSCCDSKNPTPTQQEAPHLCQECIDSLISTIEAYIEMHEIIPHGSRSWIHLHSAISAAFLLSVDEGAQSEPTVWMMLEKLEKVLCDLTSADSSPDQRSHSPADSGREWSPPFSSRGNSDHFANSSSNNNNNMHSIMGIGSYGQTFMLSDFPLGADLLMQGTSFNPRTMPASGGGVEFLTGTLSSLRKINAGFRAAQRTGSIKSIINAVEKNATAGGASSCCMSRKRGVDNQNNPNPMGCHGRQRTHV